MPPRSRAPPARGLGRRAPLALLCASLLSRVGAAEPPMCCGASSALPARGVAHERSEAGAARPAVVDVPTFVINLNRSTESLRRMRARLCPLLAPSVCAYRVAAAEPAELRRAGYAYILGGSAWRVETAIALSHLRAAAQARALCPNSSLVLVMEDDMHFGLLPLRAAAAARWPPARGGLRALAAQLPAGWTYAQLQTLARVAFLEQLQRAWRRAGSPGFMPMAAADHRPRGCASSCCAVHTTLGTGAYLLSARGLELMRSWWPPREHASAGGGLGGGAACWSLPASGCEPRPELSRAGGDADESGGWAGIKLKPSLIADHCLSRPDKYGPPLPPAEAAAAWAARRPRDTAPLRAAWQPYVATPPLVLGERSEQWAAGEPARLHAGGHWLALTLERGGRFAAGWWEALR